MKKDCINVIKKEIKKDLKQKITFLPRDQYSLIKGIGINPGGQIFVFRMHFISIAPRHVHVCASTFTLILLK